jgi:hypothetical protein
MLHNTLQKFLKALFRIVFEGLKSAFIVCFKGPKLCFKGPKSLKIKFLPKNLFGLKVIFFKRNPKQILKTLFEITFEGPKSAFNTQKVY